MKRFSERMGFTPVKSKIQVESIDEELKNRLWTRVHDYWVSIRNDKSADPSLRDDIASFIDDMWDNYFKVPLDTVPPQPDNVRQAIRDIFFKIKWYEIYDLIEYLARYCPEKYLSERFIERCNKVFKEELSGYRFVGDTITPITSEEEISEIEEALETPLTPVKTHIKTALDLLSNRKEPDYRNSIKESISAVESICNLITGEQNTPLGTCLNTIEEKILIHRALKRAFSSLYGYTSSANGIRHALLDETEPDFEDAKFMLVSCSAFVNYLVVKSSKAGITFN